MASTQTTPAVEELRIEICPDDWAQYIGTSDRLRSEGLVPESIQWPQASSGVRWEAGGLSYWLRRIRPEGHKGPKRSWLALDHWCLRVSVAGMDYRGVLKKRLERKERQLSAERRALTPLGLLEEKAAFGRYVQTLNDERFQAFRALLPGMSAAMRTTARKLPSTI